MILYDLTGKRFGRLTVVSRAKNKGRHVHWNCCCECGGTKVLASSNIVRGLTQSCGCLHRDAVKISNGTHNMSNSRIFTIWQNMKRRCADMSDQNYGGRGITVCERWLASFDNFFADMGNPPSCEHSIDRISVNGNYELSNCRWATTLEQSLNKRTNKVVYFDGLIAPLKQHCLNQNISYKSVHARITRGWSVSDALTTPIKSTNAA